MPAQGNAHTLWGLVSPNATRTPMRLTLFTLALFAASSGLAQTASDSASLEAVLVQSTRGLSRAYAETQVDRATLLAQGTGRDLPVLLQWQPSLLITSDAGNGVGYTGIRVRGSDATRTNVTVNGVPINDAESQGVFWVNMPDLSQSAASVQVQRGVGSSTNGTGAFGATVNIQTESSVKAKSLLHLSYGSFGTQKFSLSHSSGLLRERWSFDIRLSNINSNGFIDRAASELQSYWASASYPAGKEKQIPIKLLHFGGREKTYQAWWGVPIEKYKGNPSDLRDHYERNLGYTYRNSQDSANLFNSKPEQYNYYLYPNETDNYGQYHTHLYSSIPLAAHQRLNATLFHTYGAGYFEQFKPQGNLQDYGVGQAVDSTLWIGDITRQRWLQNHLFGMNMAYEGNFVRTQIQAGLFASQYKGQHFGDITAISTADLASALRYYQSTGDKFDASAFVKIRHKLSPFQYVSVDLQQRMVAHQGLGTDNDLLSIDFQHQFQFFNPKIAWEKEGPHHQLYASLSRSHREPARSDYTDGGSTNAVRPERLDDLELGWRLYRSGFQFSANAFAMFYQDQLVLTGRVNDVGTPLRTNVDRSQRMGLELESQALLLRTSQHQLSAMGNLTLSDNRIAAMDIVWLDYATWEEHITQVSNTPISYSPAFLAMAGGQYQQAAWTFQLRNRWVGRQYLDNSGELSRSLDPYSYAELQATYQARKALSLGKGSFSPVFDLQIINVFNTRYASNGYSWGYTYGSADVIQEVFVFPQAGRHFLLSMRLNF